MKQMNINQELTLSYADGFHVMTAEELIKFGGTGVNHSGLYDEARHAFIIVSWTPPGWLNYLTDAKSVVGGAERCMKKNLRNYCREDSFKAVIASHKAFGIRFVYSATDVDVWQVGELSAFRVNNKFYAVQYVSRKSCGKENRKIYEEVLQSMTVQ